MIVRITAGRAAPGRGRELAAAYRDLVLPALADQPGSLGAVLARDPTDHDRWLSLAGWRDLQSAERYATGPSRQAALVSLRDLITGTDLRVLAETVIGGLDVR